MSSLCEAEGEHSEEVATSHSRNKACSVLKGRNFIVTEVKAIWDEAAEDSEACCFVVITQQKA